MNSYARMHCFEARGFSAHRIRTASAADPTPGGYRCRTARRPAPEAASAGHASCWVHGTYSTGSYDSTGRVTILLYIRAHTYAVRAWAALHDPARRAAR